LVGAKVGVEVGISDGSDEKLGAIDEPKEGANDGIIEGNSLGCNDGCTDESFDGEPVSSIVGCKLGKCDGAILG